MSLTYHDMLDCIPIQSRINAHRYGESCDPQEAVLDAFDSEKPEPDFVTCTQCSGDVQCSIEDACRYCGKELNSTAVAAWRGHAAVPSDDGEVVGASSPLG